MQVYTKLNQKIIINRWVQIFRIMDWSCRPKKLLGATIFSIYWTKQSYSPVCINTCLFLVSLWFCKTKRIFASANIWNKTSIFDPVFISQYVSLLLLPFDNKFCNRKSPKYRLLQLLHGYTKFKIKDQRIANHVQNFMTKYPQAQNIYYLNRHVGTPKWKKHNKYRNRLNSALVSKRCEIIKATKCHRFLLNYFIFHCV